MIKVMYLIVYASSSYNIIIRRHVFNLRGYSISALYLRAKYLIKNKGIGMIKEI